MKGFVVFLIGALAFVYLLNFTIGIFELPDNLPFIGNMDEGLATLLFINALKYFGIDVTNIFKRNNEKKLLLTGKNDHSEFRND